MAENLKDIVNKLGKLRDLIAVLNTSDGDRLYSKELVDSLDREYTTLQGTIDRLWQDSNTNTSGLSSEVKQLITEENEWVFLKSLMSSTSSKDRQIAQTKIDELSNAIKDKIVYSPQSYYNTYFSTNTTGVKVKNEFFNKEGVITETNAFKQWFNESVLIEDGKPIIFYHGTSKDVYVRFDFDLFPGMYFAESLEYAEFFAGKEGNIYEVYLKVANPIDLRLFGVDKVKYDEFVGYIELKYGYALSESKMLRAISERENGVWAWQYLRQSPTWLKEISNNSPFDGIRFFENNISHQVNGKDAVTPAVMVFKENQIKSAKGNLTFSSFSKDIRFDEGGKIYK